MKNLLTSTLLVVSGLLLSIQVTANSAVESLVSQLSPVSALSGHFSQVQKDAEGEVLSRSSGDFVMQRPGLLRWETVAPFPQLLVTDGNRIWLYDEDLEQVTISSVSDNLNQTPAIIFSGDLKKIENQFYVVENDAVQQGKSDFTLRPKKTGEAYQRLDITFEDELIKTMVILDSFGQTTQFDLTDVKAENSKPISDFQFQPPEGADVLKQD
ncbi:outer membrane lipoprotein chaperone LolA [Pseudomaricurvus sp.]|uniref:outer membrane lipoprotein chaperone LolA n=1 Tax=Pseudomaricurvus sp. TaxID=2004510 RepID=UPI003F6B96BF